MRVLSSGLHPELMRDEHAGGVQATTRGDPRLQLLTGPEATEILAAALDCAGGRLLRWSLREVDCRPEDRTTVSYAAVVAWPDGEHHETLAASVSSTEPTGGLTITDGHRYVQVWRFPFDPELPGLPGACDRSTVAELLRSLGVDPVGLRLQVVSYRPRKRAVVEVLAGRHRLFLKVLRPRLVADVHGRHRMLTAVGIPVPRSLGWSEDGVVVLAALPGRLMRAVLDTGVVPLGAPQDLIDLLDALPAEIAELPRRPSWSANVSHYAEVVAAACPDHGARLRSLAGDIRSALARYGHGDEPTHGDFYDSQLLVSCGAVTGLLDIDAMGPGRRADDLACMLAHLSVLTTLDCDAAIGARRALAEWTPVFEQRVSPEELRVRAAGVVMSLATGPFRAQEPGWQTATSERISLVEQWLEAAVSGGRPGV
jgi:hypothetical protein